MWGEGGRQREGKRSHWFVFILFPSAGMQSVCDKICPCVNKPVKPRKSRIVGTLCVVSLFHVWSLWIPTTLLGVEKANIVSLSQEKIQKNK
jgi:hypothetical protein